MTIWGWLLIGLAVVIVVNTAWAAYKKGELNWFGVGSGVMHVFDALLSTFNSLATQFMGMFKDLLEPRFALALVLITGFEIGAYQVLIRLPSDAPPEAKFAIINLMLVPAGVAVGYFFRVAEEAVRNGANGRRPEPPAGGTPPTT